MKRPLPAFAMTRPATPMTASTAAGWLTLVSSPSPPRSSRKCSATSPTSGASRSAAASARRTVHRVRYRERDRLAIHYHQSYQVRAWKRTRPSFLLERAGSDSPGVHLFDEPQFNTQDGYIGFMVQFFRKLRAEGRLVFVCLHPNESWHVDILRETCERFIFVDRGRLTHAADFATLQRDERVRGYLGALDPTAITT